MAPAGVGVDGVAGLLGEEAPRHGAPTATFTPWITNQSQWYIEVFHYFPNPWILLIYLGIVFVIILIIIFTFNF